MKQDRSIFSIIILLITLISCQKSQERTSFELNGKSELRIINQSEDSIKVTISNWVYLPMYEEKIDTLIAPNQSLELPISTQTKHYFNLTVGNKQYRIFAITEKTNEVYVSGNESLVTFIGELSEINEFLKTRSIDSDWKPRGSWNQGKGTISDLLAAYDSITNSQKEQLETNDNIPIWYGEFESSRLDYVNAESKLSALGYRIKMLSINDTVSDDYLSQVVKDLPVENVDFIGVTAYMRFVGWYLSYKKDPSLKENIPSSKEEWIASSVQRIKASEENIVNQRIKEVLLAEEFIGIIDRRKHIWDDSWLKHIKDSELSALVKQQIRANPILPKGTKLPYFYLSDLDSTFYEPINFKGKLLLINFWATWCKPCYQEFDHENELVERFKNEAVEIVNICIESEQNKWREVVEKHSLKTMNLFATQNWSENINKNFETSALPHSILIDWNGKVIQNKCPRPSAGVDELITEALNEMKNEANKTYE